ncbi:hypothetical protein [Staphylococcus pseudintermedius]|uniref:hypothetical protein n=1 Tax=Staphylococcus pseudintermedius TaxID=283734 RepID=UPI000B2ADA1A|nr:hypothetical protein [Staphylococcus pseudintermedius]MDT0967723.1 hypothetical protein [Staphylococcus pseudintermedius]MDT1130577.1 hypothetical protein [Staphylococcus pseudintermedius]WQJ40865.1 hypothetical protein P3U08_12045 [Staphylococcus pseudintermedius]WQL31823.1 hypothetical protein P3U23_11765 [Staphylococcus pseudintermedius]
MKYRMMAIVVFLIVALTYVFFIQPRLTLDNQAINFISILVLFSICALIGFIGRKMDKK